MIRSNEYNSIYFNKGCIEVFEFKTIDVTSISFVLTILYNQYALIKSIDMLF